MSVVSDDKFTRGKSSPRKSRNGPQKLAKNKPGSDHPNLARTEQMLEAIRKHERALQLIIDSMPAGVMLLDSELKLLAWNKVYMRYFGPSVKWRVGASLDSVLPQAEESGITSRLHRAVRTGRAVRVREFRYDGLRQGVTYWRGVAAPVDTQLEDGSKAALAVVAVEVTEEVVARERLEQLAALAQRRADELEEERARLNSIIESMPVALLVCNSDLDVVASNSVARQYAEALRTEELSETISEAELSRFVQALHGNGAPPTEESAILRSLQGECCKGHTKTLRGRSDTEMTVSTDTAPLRDANGEVVGVVVACSDITEQIHAEEHILEIYRREHAVVEKLQASFMLTECPKLDRFDMAQRYKAALDEALVGGDFYDVFRVDDQKLGVVIADVAGKGLKAAVYTAMTKYMLRAYALEESAPELVLARLNEALSACTPTEVFVTLIYGILDAEEGTFNYASAGHEHPIHYSVSARAGTMLDVTGRALALLQGSSYTTQTVLIDRGDVLLLYTDGITDAGWGVNRLGQERLQDMVVAGAALSAREIADHVMSATLEFGGGRAVDDAALVVIKGR